MFYKGEDDENGNKTEEKKEMADKLAKLALINKPIIECKDGYTFIKDIEIGELIRTQSILKQ